MTDNQNLVKAQVRLLSSWCGSWSLGKVSAVESLLDSLWTVASGSRALRWAIIWTIIKKKYSIIDRYGTHHNIPLLTILKLLFHIKWCNLCKCFIFVANAINLVNQRCLLPLKWLNFYKKKSFAYIFNLMNKLNQIIILIKTFVSNHTLSMRI